MRERIAEWLCVAGFMAELYSAGVGDGGGSWATIIAFAVAGIVLIGTAYRIASKDERN